MKSGAEQAQLNDLQLPWLNQPNHKPDNGKGDAR
jgi:hypothetical protein